MLEGEEGQGGGGHQPGVVHQQADFLAEPGRLRELLRQRIRLGSEMRGAMDVRAQGLLDVGEGAVARAGGACEGIGRGRRLALAGAAGRVHAALGLLPRPLGRSELGVEGTQGGVEVAVRVVGRGGLTGSIAEVALVPLERIGEGAMEAEALLLALPYGVGGAAAGLLLALDGEVLDRAHGSSSMRSGRRSRACSML